MRAAGFSRRYGSDKRRAPFHGQTLLNASLALPCSRLTEVWLVLRPEDDCTTLGIPAEVRVVRNPAAAQGMGHSLACGISQLQQNSSADAVAVFLADMPWISPASLDALLAQATAERIVVPTYQDQPGHPVLFGRQFWPLLAKLSGDTGGRAVLKSQTQAVHYCPVDDPGILLDIDTQLSIENSAGG